MPLPNEASAVVLGSNPVWRSYSGGSLLRRFRGCPGAPDNHFPEDWLASTVRARNGRHSQGADEGLSILSTPAETTLLCDALQRDPGFWWGGQSRQSPGVLWKLLDSAVRLQLQAHPDARFAREHFGSNAGKTECWYILGTRQDDAHVYLGFQHPPGRQDWKKMIEEQRIEAMLDCFERILVRPGDCFAVPAGTPHAIGAGVFMMELQEPTDWVVRCETTTAGLKLPPELCFMGLDLDRCLDVFNYERFSVNDVRSRFQQKPRVIRAEDTFREHEIIAPEFHHFFRLHRLSGRGEATWSGGELMLLLVLKGAATLISNGGARQVAAGETWLLPGSLAEWKWTGPAADWEVLLAKLPTLPG